jgi:hypothetical protein
LSSMLRPSALCERYVRFEREKQAPRKDSQAANCAIKQQKNLANKPGQRRQSRATPHAVEWAIRRVGCSSLGALVWCPGVTVAVRQRCRAAAVHDREIDRGFFRYPSAHM